MRALRGRFALAWALGSLLPLGLAPAAARAESRYSLRGYGEWVPAVEASARAQGAAHAAAPVPSVGGNPASLALADQTRFSGTYETQWVRTQEDLAGGALRVRKDYDSLVPNLAFIAPIGGSWRLGTGLLVERRKGGRIVGDATTPDGEPYTQVYDATGNLMRIPAVVATTVRGVQVGGGLDVMLLNQEVRWENDFGPESGFDDSDDLDKLSLWGVAWRLGARVPVGERLAVGAWGSLPSKLDGSRRLENDDPLDDSDDLKIDRGGEIARRWGAGVYATPFDRLRLRADVEREMWADVAKLSPVDDLVDVTRFAVGAQWDPSVRRRGLRMPLRAGYRTELLHTRDTTGREVREHVFTGGSGIGFGGGAGTLDWYVEYGWRGEKGVSEYSDQFVRFGITLTGVETWTRRRDPQDEDDGDW